jgi:hypothetical protein
VSHRGIDSAWPKKRARGYRFGKKHFDNPVTAAYRGRRA